MPLKKLGNYVNSSRNQVIDNHVRQSFPATTAILVAGSGRRVSGKA